MLIHTHIYTNTLTYRLGNISLRKGFKCSCKKEKKNLGVSWFDVQSLPGKQLEKSLLSEVTFLFFFLII